MHVMGVYSELSASLSFVFKLMLFYSSNFFALHHLLNPKTNCQMTSTLSSCTGGMFFGPSDSGAVKSIRDTLSKQKVPHEVLYANDANKRFSALNLPANYVCMLEDGAGILRASVAVQALQVNFTALYQISLISKQRMGS